MSEENRVFIVEMPDASKWAVPVHIIKKDRVLYYSKGDPSLVAESVEDTNELFADDYEVEDWARNNMNWSDVKGRAKQVSEGECDYQEGWMNGEGSVEFIALGE